ncbi:PREDICTED: GSK3-beta interaction protein-like [Amphimedon queenslandica]|uniref:GSKIP domain-containing protein n=1 Tax=Amphimedon queenslandica TaxID=400682 RepID=A0A1X7UF86_AMPQE|nr:PREDICTED: GSK3-beta interaction protein-like [Amphimedon queenslandica]|eukprot:XP_011405354.1 PREDICTED: GSK3-beta interaction protein-like [Amphimedon queenslandica]
MASSIELIDFRAEGIHSLKDIGYAINEGRVSEVLPSSSSSVYLNIITQEDKEFCVLLDKNGYQVVGFKCDCVDEGLSLSVYETIYSLMDSISDSYKVSFNTQLFNKLKHYQQGNKDEK